MCRPTRTSQNTVRPSARSPNCVDGQPIPSECTSSRIADSAKFSAPGSASVDGRLDRSERPASTSSARARPAAAAFVTPRRSAASQAASPAVEPAPRARSHAVRARSSTGRPRRRSPAAAGTRPCGGRSRPWRGRRSTRGRVRCTRAVRGSASGRSWTSADGLVAEPVRVLDDQMCCTDPEQGLPAIGVQGRPCVRVDEDAATDAEPAGPAYQRCDVPVEEPELPRLTEGDQSVLVGHQTEYPWIHAPHRARGPGGVPLGPPRPVQRAGTQGCGGDRRGPVAPLVTLRYPRSCTLMTSLYCR